MTVLVEAQTVATCSEIIVTTIVQQFGSLRAAFQTLMDFVRLLTPSRRLEKIPHGWDYCSDIERKPVDSMKRRMFVYLRIQSNALFQRKEYAGGPPARFWNCIQRETALVPSQCSGSQPEIWCLLNMSVYTAFRLTHVPVYSQYSGQICIQYSEFGLHNIYWRFWLTSDRLNHRSVTAGQGGPNQQCDVTNTHRILTCVIS